MIIPFGNVLEARGHEIVGKQIKTDLSGIFCHLASWGAYILELTPARVTYSGHFSSHKSKVMGPPGCKRTVVIRYLVYFCAKNPETA